MKEKIAKYVFLSCALFTVLSLVIIVIFIFAKGLPAIFEIGLINFIFGSTWDPSQGLYGIFPMVVASIFTTALAFALGVYIAKWTAIFLVFYCNKKVYKIIKPMIELLAGIPSVVYGFFGLLVIVPFIRNVFGGPGKSTLAVILVLAIMILPTIINLSEKALNSVPKIIYQGAVGLGMTHNEAVFHVVVPAAKRGMISAYVLGIGRALGETTAVILVAGNNPRMPFHVLKPVRTLTTGISMEMNYATGLHQEALFGIGVVLFILIFVLNIALNIIIRKEV